MNIQQYFDRVNQRFQSGISTEHSYRGDLQLLLETICNSVDVTNEPVRIACGAPDFILTQKKDPNLPVGYIEAKDLNDHFKLDLIEKNDQILRYRGSLNNFLLTNYVEFRFFLNGEKATKISIAKIDGHRLLPYSENWPAFENLLKDFSKYSGITIRTAQKLAEIMASKAKLMQQVIQIALDSDEQSNENSSLKDQMRAFKNILIHDITTSEFADLYAQTIAYGMFAARLHDQTLSTFSRQEAAELIPNSNPFLKKLFGYIAGVEIDDRIVWIIDALADVFRVTDVASILKNFGKPTRMQDPMIHFYETFLAEYNPKLRKSRGVWYTPEPVVNFIVRATDELLKNEFQLDMGLGDDSKIKVKKKENTKATADKRSKIKEVEVDVEVHRVQILDPAVGTGTFLAEIVKQVHSKFEGQQGVWSQYVENDLIPRLYGFELLMASYAMAHLKLDLLLKQTGYAPSKKENRLRIYLTNSLEEAHPDSQTLLASWLSQEATEANVVKRDAPVMVVLGNPPYSVSSSNKDEWIQKLISDYKINLNEKKLNLDDDYIKFIRYAQYFVEKNGQGIVALITNNSYIDAITCRQMRKSLFDTFDKIYIFDLHGSTKKNESSPDGGKDENVFDIQQGVAISLMIKTSNGPRDRKQIYHYDSYGSREDKYKLLSESSISSIDWRKLQIEQPNYFFVPKDFNKDSEYNHGFSINEMWPVSNSGISTDRDSLFVDFDEVVISKRVKKLLSGVLDPEFIQEFRVVDSGSYKITRKIKDKHYNDKYIAKMLYRPFDIRYTYYDHSLISRPAFEVMGNMFMHKNLSLITCRQQSSFDFQHIFIANLISEGNSISLQTRERSYVYPLFLYKKPADINFKNDDEIVANLNLKLVHRIENELGLHFEVPQDPFLNGDENKLTPVDILDYAYAVLHHPGYRKTNKEHFRIDFPRVPFPKQNIVFRSLVNLGTRLRHCHLLETKVLNPNKYPYARSGTNEVSKLRLDIMEPEINQGNIFINEIQCFENVPLAAWDFYIGGFQPAQKWLKDRKGRNLSFEDIVHYQKLIAALVETIEIVTQLLQFEF